jgi:alpha-galactosidase
MRFERIELRYRLADGSETSISQRVPDRNSTSAATKAGIELIARRGDLDGRPALQVSIHNRSREPIRLDRVHTEIATGFDPNRPARFFKHGFQSWSASGAVTVGETKHRRDTGSSISRLAHQSEAARPTEAPEGATSELFTVISGAGVSKSVMAGFVGGAHELTTITVTRPDAALARILLDGVALAPGAERDCEPIILDEDESPAALAERWAQAFGNRMQGRVGASYQRGWCSWYHYFHDITEDALRANIGALAAMRERIPIEVIQLDDGFQSALGDWDTTNAKFPNGLKRIADEIRNAGFAAGIWTAPFLCARDSVLMRDHPKWLLTNENREPIRAGYNKKWTSDPEGFAYALDPSNADFRAHLERLFARLVHEFGYAYLKLDFLFAAAAEGRRHDSNITRAEMLRRGLEAIRAGAGDDTFILGCGCPLGPAVGVVDGMRIGPDVAPYWGSSARDPSTVYALDAIIARSYMHRRLWLNDPDCLMLRARETQLTADERYALAATIAASGGMLLISDDMSLVDDAAAALYRIVAKVGAHADADAALDAVLPIDLMSSGNVRGMRQGKSAMLLNRGDEAARVSLAELGLSGADEMLADIAGNESPAAGEIVLAPHSARFVRSYATAISITAAPGPACRIARACSAGLPSFA